MQTEITVPAKGIETIDPTDAVIENPGACRYYDRPRPNRIAVAQFQPQ